MGPFMTSSSDEMPPEPEYDEILRKLDALLRSTRAGLPPQRWPKQTMVRVLFQIPSRKAVSDHTSLKVSLSTYENIPTLTETVYVTPAMLSPQSDITLYWSKFWIPPSGTPGSIWSRSAQNIGPGTGITFVWSLISLCSSSIFDNP